LKPSSALTKAAAVTIGFLGALALWWDYLIFFPLRNGLEKTGMTLREYLNLESGEFQNGFSVLSSSIWSPVYSMRAAGWTGWLVFVAFLASIGLVYWKRHHEIRRGRFGWTPHFILPLAVGAFCQPILLKRLFGVNAENGLDGPWYVGAILGESLASLYLGCLGTAAVLVLMFVLHLRSKTGRSSDEVS
jgi:hypothetical protein